MAGDWEGHNVVDHLRGKIGYGATATGVVEDRFGKRAGEFTVNCADNSTTAYMAAKGLYFGSAELIGVEYTIDGGPVQKAQWSTCQGRDCVGLWNGAGIPFVKSLLDKALLKIVAHRSFAEPIYGSFAIAGSDELRLIGKLCGWISKN